MLLANRQKYTAIALSLFIHIFLLVLLFFLILSQYRGSSIGNQFGKEITDTLFYEPISTQPEEIIEPETESELDSAAAAVADNINSSIPEETIQNYTAPTTLMLEEQQQATLPALGRDAIALQVPESESVILPKNTRPGTKKIRRRKKRPGFSFAKLAQGFKNYNDKKLENATSTNHEWLDESLKEKLKDGVYIDNKGIPHRASDVKKDPRYAHVDDEFAKMAFFSYMKGVNTGLKNAFSMTRETVYFDEKREEKYSLEIIIIADGSVSEVRILQHFEKREFDDYVIRTIKSYQFAPLPARLKTPHIIKRLDAIVHARAGTNRFELHINY
jgi:hypothetical protein